MQAFRLTRVPLGALFLLGLAGCNSILSSPTAETIVARQIHTGSYTFRDLNEGRILGTIDANPVLLAAAGVKTLEGAQAQAFDPDGTPLNDKVSVDKDGHFIMSGLTPSRPRIFVEANVNGLRFRATMLAPRDRKDYGVVLDAGTTYLADKLRRAALDHDVAFDRLDSTAVGDTEAIVNSYLPDAQRRDVLEQTNPDLNAYSFDHFMDDNGPVKQAVYRLSPAILRGWTPPPIEVVPSEEPIIIPTVAPTPTPSPTPTGPAPK